MGIQNSINQALMLTAGISKFKTQTPLSPNKTIIQEQQSLSQPIPNNQLQLKIEEANKIAEQKKEIKQFQKDTSKYRIRLKKILKNKEISNASKTSEQ